MTNERLRQSIEQLTDHQRGCAGRDYTCTCGYDDASDNSLKDAAAEWQSGYAAGIEAAVNALEADAKKCDCFARNEGECGCGAWCEWKSITSARAIEIVSAVKEQSA
jgi:hypothetical protein